VSDLGRAPRWWWGPPALVAAVVLARYAGTVGAGLVSDDYLWIGVVREGIASVVTYHGGYHYNPVALAWLYLEHALSGPRALGYHAGSQGLFLATALLVGRTGLVLGLPRRVSWAGALLFATSRLLFEGPLWAIGIFYSLSTSLSLLALAMFVAHERTGRPRHAAGFVGCLVLALLTHEQAIGLIAVCLVWTSLGHGRSTSLAEALRRRALTLIVPALLVIAFVGLKLILAHGEPQAPGLALGRRLTSPFAVNLTRVLVPNVSADQAAALVRPPIPEWARVPWRAAMIVAGAGVFLIVGRRARFLIAWAALQVGVMVAGIGGMSSRHFVLALAPGSLLAATVLDRLATWIGQGGGRRRPAAAVAVFAASIAGCAVIGLVTLDERIRIWMEASRTADAIVLDVGRHQTANPGASRLYAVDLPDGLPIPGEVEPAYVFRLGFESAVAWRYPGRFQLIATLRSEPDGPLRRTGRALSPGDLQHLLADPGNLIVRYDASARRLQVLR